MFLPMLHLLFEHFNRTSPVPEDEFNTLCQVVKPVQVKKNTHLFKQFKIDSSLTLPSEKLWKPKRLLR
jgi:hypothetical protein